MTVIVLTLTPRADFSNFHFCQELEHARSRGASIYAELKGYGCSADSHHITAPKENGEGAYMAMKKALKQAQLNPAAIDYINAHATSTVVGDAAENAAIKTLLLGPEGKQHAADINVSSTKGALGHLLGGAGAVEALFTVMAIRDVCFPPELTSRCTGALDLSTDCSGILTDLLEYHAAYNQLESLGRWLRLQLCTESSTVENYRCCSDE